jgi:hypothetical protein
MSWLVIYIEKIVLSNMYFFTIYGIIIFISQSFMKKPAPKKSFSSSTPAKKFSPRTPSFTPRETISRAPRTERGAQPFRKEFTKREATATSTPKNGYQGKASNFNPNFHSEKKSNSNISVAKLLRARKPKEGSDE